MGSAGPPGRYAVLYPELEERFFSEEVRPSQPDDRLLLTEEDVTIINEELKPYWEGKRYHTAFMDALPEETRRLVELYFVITPTATARSSLAWNHDYEKVLKRGIKGIREEAEEKLASFDPLDPKDQVEKEPFLNAVILVCDAIVGFARRYAELARSMAEEEIDRARKRELLEIAEVCDRVPENPARTFREAVQSQWFIQTVSRLEQRIGGTVGNGRIDQYFYPFYKRTSRRAGSPRTRPWNCWSACGSAWPETSRSTPPPETSPTRTGMPTGRRPRSEARARTEGTPPTSCPT